MDELEELWRDTHRSTEWLSDAGVQPWVLEMMNLIIEAEDFDAGLLSNAGV